VDVVAQRGCGGSQEMWWLSRGCDGSVGHVVAQLDMRWLSWFTPNFNETAPGSILAYLTVSSGEAGIMAVYRIYVNGDEEPLPEQKICFFQRFAWATILSRNVL
jgi:hypothetical protein